MDNREAVDLALLTSWEYYQRSLLPKPTDRLPSSFRQNLASVFMLLFKQQTDLYIQLDKTFPHILNAVYMPAMTAGPFACFLCQGFFADLVKHLSEVHRLLGASLDEYFNTFQSDYTVKCQVNLLAILGTKLLCHICSRVVPTNSLQEHVATHYCGNSSLCLICGQEVPTVILETHAASH